MNYTIFFEIFGKKLKTTIEADSEDDAKYKLYGKIKFHKVEKENPAKNWDLPEGFVDIFGGKI